MKRYIDRADVPATLRNAFGYSGTKFCIEAAETVELLGAYWDGGSRSQYLAVCLATGERKAAVSSIANPPQFGGPSAPVTVTIQPGWVIAQHSIFCGKDMGVTFYARADDLAPLLPAPADAIAPELVKVLRIMRGLKPAYRRIEAEREGISVSEYERCLAELKRLGLVSKQNALTLAGKNAAQE